VYGFSINRSLSSTHNTIKIKNNELPTILYANEIDNDELTSSEASKKSLEDKMKDWEASDEEIKAASLGGVVPGRTDGFDIGLFIAFPFIVGSALLFAVFPFIMDKIDVSSVGPPPTI
jgi:hypothetical protein